MGQIPVKIDYVVVHCPDNKWIEAWLALCCPGASILRVPLPGVRTQSSFLRETISESVSAATPIVIGSHGPTCAAFTQQEVLREMPKAMGNTQAEYLYEIGHDNVAHFHFRQGKFELYDMASLNGRPSHPIIGDIHQRAKVFAERTKRVAIPESVPVPEYVVADKIFGPPPEDGTVCIHSRFAHRGTLDIVAALNGGSMPSMVKTGVYSTL